MPCVIVSQPVFEVRFGPKRNVWAFWRGPKMFKNDEDSKVMKFRPKHKKNMGGWGSEPSCFSRKAALPVLWGGGGISTSGEGLGEQWYNAFPPPAAKHWGLKTANFKGSSPGWNQRLDSAWIFSKTFQASYFFIIFSNPVISQLLLFYQTCYFLLNSGKVSFYFCCFLKPVWFVGWGMKPRGKGLPVRRRGPAGPHQSAEGGPAGPPLF